MSCAQLVTPNLDPVLHSEGHVLTNWVGWCLLYTQTAFHSGWAGSNAWEAWNDHVKIKHQDRNIPSGMYVPIWFSGYHGMGHSCIYKDGHIWSTPLHAGFTAAQWNSIEEVEQHYGVSYVGWSEDIGGTQVVEYTPDPVPAPTPPPEPVPVPEAPAPVPPTPPSGAMPIPSPNEPYTLVVDVPGYVTSNAAVNHLGASTTVQAGSYSVFNKRFDKADPTKLLAINITHTAGVAGNWINPDDNHEPVPEPTPAPTDNGWLGPRESGTPEPTPVPVVEPPKVYKPSEVPIGTQDDNTWKATFRYFYADKRGVSYITTNGQYMKDYSGKKKPVWLDKGTKINMYGTFTKNGVSFYRARDALNDAIFSWYYAISQVDDDGNANVVKYVAPVVQEIETLSEHFQYLKSDIKGIWDIIRRKI